MTGAIVLSCGRGQRFGAEIPKQYTEILGEPVIVWTLKAFEKSIVDEIVLVCAEEDLEYCRKEIVDKYNITKCKDVIVGGKERYNSVYAGLLALTDSDFCLIHDGARPCIDPWVINRAVEYVSSTGSCVVGVPVVDTIQVTDDDGYISYTTERKNTWIAQTPQCFRTSLALESYKKAVAAKDDTVTDDAMVVSKYGGGKIMMIRGNRENIKLTTKEDIIAIEEYLRNV